MNPLFEPNYLNVEFIFYWLFQAIGRWLSLAWLERLLSFLFTWRYFLFGLILIMMAALIYLFVKLYRLRQAEDAELALPMIALGRADTTRRNEEWERVKNYLNSENPADWKIAIIEADKILDALVKKMNYPGETLGERLKAIEPSDFLTLNEAWEAHRLRNQIAHEPDFNLSAREARRGIELFEKVFREFDYI